MALTLVKRPAARNLIGCPAQIGGGAAANRSGGACQEDRPAVSALWASDGAEYVEGTAFRGHDELFARVSGAHEAFVASGRFTVTAGSDTSRHADIVAFTIQLGAPSGEVAWAARVFLMLDDDGHIREDYQLTVKPLAE